MPIMRLQQNINVNTTNSERETALHMAAANGHYSAVIYLLNHGENVHARTIKKLATYSPCNKIS